jgi:hypothetical protein
LMIEAAATSSHPCAHVLRTLQYHHFATGELEQTPPTEVAVQSSQKHDEDTSAKHITLISSATLH